MDKSVEGADNTRTREVESVGEVARRRLGTPIYLYPEEMAALVSILTLVQDGRQATLELKRKAHRLREIVGGSL